MKKKLRILIPVLIIGLLVYLTWRYYAGQEQQPAGAIAGNGVVEATEVDVSSQVAGNVLTLTVNEGDPVNAGQLIAILDNAPLSGQVEQARGNLQATQATLSELQAGTRSEDIRRAQAQYAAALDVLKQAQARRDLVREGPRKEDIAQLRAAYEQAKAQRDLVHAGARPEQIAQLRAAYEQAKAARDLVKAGPRQEQIAQLKAALERDQVNLADAERELQRAQKLEAQGAIAGQQVDQARTRRDAARTQVEASRQRLAEAQAGARPQELEQAEKAVEIARQRLAEAEAGARPQEIKAADAAAEVARQRLEAALAGARPQELRDADAAVASAQAQSDAARAALDLALSGPRPQTVEAARGRVVQAQGTLKTAEATQAQTKIISPSEGRVTLRNVEPGSLVTPGLPIVRIADLRKVKLKVYVPEPQHGLIKIGQRATVTTDSSTTTYEGRVIEIAETPEFTPKNVQTKEERVKLVFAIKIEVDNPDQELKPGMPADALISVGK
ncbi:MAG: HlyD family efflux transporter periplasmic adaptor subunit [Armatimonadota bacterium]